MKNRKTLLLMSMVIAWLLSACGSTSSTNDYGNGISAVVTEMNPDDLEYYPVNTYWSGADLVVEGGFFNFTSEYDVTGLENAVIYMVDSDYNVVATVQVNEAAVGVVPHNGESIYNFTVSSITGGSTAYKATSLRPVLETEFTYAEHQAGSCPYCGGVPVVPSPSSGANNNICTWCDGKGYTTCIVCKGTGVNEDYDKLSPVQKAFQKRYCESCDGNGVIECGRCHGSGID